MCSCESRNKKNSSECPNCQNQGKPVRLETLQSLLLAEAKAKLDETQNYYFCPNSQCDVVYFSNEPKISLFTKDLSVKVTQKDQGLGVNVCYCFGHTRQSVLNEIRNSGHSTVLEDIKKKMKDPGCFCERSNPQGSCCLGNVGAWIKVAKSLGGNK